MGERLLAFRIQAAAIFEAATHLGDTVRRVPEVKAFVDGLDADAAKDSARLTAALDEHSPNYIGDWAEPHRNVTFHYPEMHPEKAKHGKEKIKRALEEAADLTSAIMAGESFGSVRFDFADEVAVQWLPEATPDNAKAVEDVRDAGLALARFVQRAGAAYLDRLPGNVITRVK